MPKEKKVKTGKKKKKTGKKIKVKPAKTPDSIQDAQGKEITKHGGHNKIEVTPEMIAKVEQYAAVGLTNDQIAALLKMHRNTLLSHCKENLDLACAIERGRAVGIQNVATKLYVKAVEKNNLMAQMFYLKTRAGWSEKTSLEISGPGGDAIETENKWTIEIINPPKKEDE